MGSSHIREFNEETACLIQLDGQLKDQVPKVTKSLRDSVSEGPASRRVSFSVGLTGLFHSPGCHCGKHAIGQGREQTSDQTLGNVGRESVEGG